MNGERRTKARRKAREKRKSFEKRIGKENWKMENTVAVVLLADAAL